MASSGLPAALAVAALLVAGCSSTSTTDTRSAPTGSCPVSPLEVVVTVDQWGDVVDSLAGACGQVTTIIGGSAGDPHDYEPTPADSAAFTSADLVVLNGLDYDHWADEALDRRRR
jgi:zinc/manganese transport system substrate-binding protein